MTTLKTQRDGLRAAALATVDQGRRADETMRAFVGRVKSMPYGKWALKMRGREAERRAKAEERATRITVKQATSFVRALGGTLRKTTGANEYVARFAGGRDGTFEYFATDIEDAVGTAIAYQGATNEAVRNAVVRYLSQTYLDAQNAKEHTRLGYDDLLDGLPDSVAVVGLGDVETLHDTIATAVGEPTTYEETRARQTGATVERLRQETATTGVGQGKLVACAICGTPSFVLFAIEVGDPDDVTGEREKLMVGICCAESDGVVNRGVTVTLEDLDNAATVTSESDGEDEPRAMTFAERLAQLERDGWEVVRRSRVQHSGEGWR